VDAGRNDVASGDVGDISVVAVDVGALRNIGWWCRAPDGATTSGRDLDSLVDCISGDISARVPVALGFEAPLFIPRPSDAADLNRQRLGERGRPWCAGAGTGAMALGLQQSGYVFGAISNRIRPRVTFDLKALSRGDADLLIWEAFVSGKAKNRDALDPHVDDARVAVDEFVKRQTSGTITSDVLDTEVTNLAAANLLAAGLTTDLGMLHQACLVIRAPELA
jgi:hypothetical protein